jgi:hypothetical protein
MKSLVRALAIAAACLFLMCCSREVRIQDLQGEWAATDAFFYMRISNDSIDYGGNPYSVYGLLSRKRPNAAYSEKLPFGLMLRNRPKFGNGELARFALEADGWANVHANPPRRIGRFYFQGDSLYLYTGDQIESTALRRLRENTSFHLERISYSKSPRYATSESELAQPLITDIELQEDSAFFLRSEWTRVHGHEVPLLTTDHYYAMRLRSEIWRQCETIVRHALVGSIDRDSVRPCLERPPRTEDERFRVNRFDELEKGALVLYVNGTKQCYLTNCLGFPPSLARLERILDMSYDRWGFGEVRDARRFGSSKKRVFESRLLSLGMLNDSLAYLELIDSSRFRPARPRGGHASVEAYLRESFHSPKLSMDWDGPMGYPLELVVDEKGVIIDVVKNNRFDELAYRFPKAKRILLGLPRWENALNGGKPTAVHVTIPMPSNLRP